MYFSLHVKLKQYQKLNPNIIESSISIRISHNVMRERMNSRMYIFLYKECKQHIKGRLFYTLHFLPPPPTPLHASVYPTFKHDATSAINLLIYTVYTQSPRNRRGKGGWPIPILA